MSPDLELARDAGSDASPDVAPDGGPGDAGSDASPDIGPDGGPGDAGSDASPDVAPDGGPGDGGQVPDPIHLGPRLDDTVATELGTSTSFLYTGADPTQTGVAPGTIDMARVAVLRGRVSTRDGAPVPDVTITVANHPELGQTKTHGDGVFDLAVNGGGSLTVSYQKNGLLAVERTLVVPWRDYAWLPDVVMIALDTTATAVDLDTAAMQVVRGSAVTDTDGARRATILFPSGTTAAMILPGGTSQPLTNLTVRATEFTVGKPGPRAMPASLPPSSGYTYAADLRVDEASAAGATEVRFSQALPVYVENFLGFPVGGAVPSGYYDRQKGHWIAAADGRVIKVLGVTNNLADLDVDGSGIAAAAAALGALAITDEERMRLALLYTAGATLWRVPVTHFSEWDFNWPIKPPDDAKPPLPGKPKPPPPKKPTKDPCGSVIGCEDQTLGESLPLSGTPWRLHYQSDRTLGRRDAFTIRIPVSDETPLPASLKRIELEVAVAGQRFTQVFPTEPNQSYAFTWNGKDAFGRALQGAQPVTVTVGYVYGGVYSDPAQRPGAEYEAAFGHFSYFGSPVSGNRERAEITLTKSWVDHVGLLDARVLAMGGWSLSIQHSYHPARRALWLGDGAQRRADSLPHVYGVVAGTTGASGFSGDGGPAKGAQMSYPEGIVMAPDGALFIADSHNHRIRRIGRDGIMTTVAGTGAFGYSGDGESATKAKLYGPTSVALGSDGALFIADYYNRRVRRIGSDGIITTVAGNGVEGSTGDGGPATAATMVSPRSVAVGVDGSLYIADEGGKRIRRVGPDGVMSTFAGIGAGGAFDFVGDGGPATAANLLSPAGVAAAPDGAVVIADYSGNRIRRVGPDGIITTVAGGGLAGSGGDGGPATSANLSQPVGVAVTSDGTLFITESGTSRIRRVGTNGIITTAAGGGASESSGVDVPATAAQLYGPAGVAVGPGDAIFVVEKSNQRVCHVSLGLSDIVGASDIVVPSEDGQELYVFSSSGRHLRTLDALTATVRVQLAYDGVGRLTAVTDADGNVTTVERDASGVPLAIVAPAGQRTALAVNADGYISRVTNPAGDAVQLAYNSGAAAGLLASLSDARANVHHYFYDDLGRLVRDESPAGGIKLLARTDIADERYAVAITTAFGLVTTYEIERLTTGDMRRVRIEPGGARTETLLRTNGSRQVKNPDGTILDIVEGPDPRFGMEAPILSAVTITTPGGATATSSATRAVTLSDAANFLSLTSLTDTLTVNGKTYTRVYDAATRKATTTTPAGRRFLVTLDAKGRRIEGSIDGITPVQMSADAQGRVTAITQGDRISKLAYDVDGHPSVATDPLGHAASFVYDAAGRVTQITRPDTQRIRFAYDANGNPISLTPPGRDAHVFGVTPANLMQSYTPPSTAGGATDLQLTHDVDGQVAQMAFGGVATMTFGYDAAGRLQSVTAPQAKVQASYDGASRLATLQTNDGVGLAYGYDSPLLTSISWSGPVQGIVRRQFDNNLRITSQTINGAYEQVLAYDADGLLSRSGALTLERSAASGLLTGTLLGAVSDTRTFNAFGEWRTYDAKAGAAAIFTSQYTRDDLGRVTALDETIAGVTVTSVYGYDLAGRLTDVKRNGVITSAYAYDANGNRVTYTGAGGVTTGVYDAQDRLTQYGATTFTYGAAGALSTATTGGQTSSYAYDLLGNLRGVTLPGGVQIDYVIDGRNRRIGKKVNGTLIQGLLYQDHLQPIAELDGNNVVVSAFVYGSRPGVPDYMIKGGATYRIISDHLGSPRLIVDVATGAVAQRLDYDEFGSVRMDTAPGFQPFGFAGGLYDRDTQLVRFGARDYDARVGRWTAKDPIGFVGGQTNVYAYIDSDPVNATDPGGLCPGDYKKCRDQYLDNWFGEDARGFADLFSFQSLFGKNGREIQKEWIEAAVEVGAVKGGGLYGMTRFGKYLAGSASATTGTVGGGIVATAGYLELALAIVGTAAIVSTTTMEYYAGLACANAQF